MLKPALNLDSLLLLYMSFKDLGTCEYPASFAGLHINRNDLFWNIYLTVGCDFMVIELRYPC